MKAHSGHVGLQDSGCRALANLAANADNTTAIAAAGGIRVVQSGMLAMKAHMEKVVVQEHGCAALTNLAANNISNKTVITSEGGISVVA